MAGKGRVTPGSVSPESCNCQLQDSGFNCSRDLCLDMDLVAAGGHSAWSCERISPCFPWINSCRTAGENPGISLLKTRGISPDVIGCPEKLLGRGIDKFISSLAHHGTEFLKSSSRIQRSRKRISTAARTCCLHWQYTAYGCENHLQQIDRGTHLPVMLVKLGAFFCVPFGVAPPDPVGRPVTACSRSCGSSPAAGPGPA